MRLAGAALVVLFACGCYCQAIIVQPAGPASTATAAVAPAGHDIVALLADPETRKVGRVIVSSTLGASVELKDKRTATRVVIGLPPSVVFRFSESQVQQLFGDTSQRKTASRDSGLREEPGGARRDRRWPYRHGRCRAGQC
jgi:hypothetical protein